jgi:hypothetical protein
MASAEVVSCATPPASATVPITVAPSLKRTLPVGVAPALVTVAVNVTGVRAAAGFDEEVTPAIVAAAL